MIASGVLGCLLGGGDTSDRIGRTATTAPMTMASGFCALAIGFVFACPPWLFIAVAVVWGVTVIGYFVSLGHCDGSDRLSLRRYGARTATRPWLCPHSHHCPPSAGGCRRIGKLAMGLPDTCAGTDHWHDRHSDLASPTRGGEDRAWLLLKGWVIALFFKS